MISTMLASAGSALLAWTPFINPINAFHQWWYMLLLPLSFGISVIYKAIRMASLEGFWRQVALMTAQIVLAMIGLAIIVALIVQWAIPWLPVE